MKWNYILLCYRQVLTTVGTFFSDILPAGWPFSAIVLGSSLFSGLLFMAVLVFIDPILYGWMADSLKPRRRNQRHRHLHHHQHQQRSPVTSESATLEPNLAPMKIGKHNSPPFFFLRISHMVCGDEEVITLGGTKFK